MFKADCRVVPRALIAALRKVKNEASRGSSTICWSSTVSARDRRGRHAAKRKLVSVISLDAYTEELHSAPPPRYASYTIAASTAPISLRVCVLRL